MRCISELRWSLEECYDANQLRIIQSERWDNLEGAGTLPGEMKTKMFFQIMISRMRLNIFTSNQFQRSNRLLETCLEPKDTF